MKKISYLPVIASMLFAMTIACASCEKGQNYIDPTNNSSDDSAGEAVNTQMTPDESKKYLTETGKEILNLYNTSDQEDAVELLEGLTWKLYDYNWDYSEFVDYATQDIEDMFSIATYLTNVASGAQSPTSTPVYTFNFARQAIIFEANDNTHTWENKGKSTDNSVVVRMKSNRSTSVEAKCWGEGPMHSYSYTYYVGDQAEERYTYINKYEYVGYSSYYDYDLWETVYTYYGDYNYEYNSYTGRWYYVYVGEGNGLYTINNDAVTYVYVGDNHGSYVRKSNSSWSSNIDDNYSKVGANRGNYERKTAADAKYRISSYGYPYTYVYDESGEYIKYSYYRTLIKEKSFANAEARTITVELPERVCFTLTEGGKEIIRFTQEFDLVENDHYNMSSNLTIVNLHWNQSLKATYSSASANMEYKYGTRTILSANINLPSFDIAKRQAGETYGEYGERIANRWEALVSEVGEISAKINLINRVQIKARVSNFGDLYNAYIDWDNKYRYMTYDAANDLRKIYNKYCLAGIYYNSDIVQALMNFDVYASEGEGGYYNVEPVIYFPSDSTSYSYGQYFSETRFGSLINLTEDVANNYINLLKLFDADPIELR